MIAVHVEIDSLEFNSRGPITGVIVLRIGNRFFPERQWHDMPAVVLGWWIEQLESLLTHESPRVRCLFMDGPFFFDATLNKRALHIQCGVRRNAGEEYVLESNVMSDVFMNNLRETALQVVNAGEKRASSSSDLKQLEVLVRKSS